MVVERRLTLADGQIYRDKQSISLHLQQLQTTQKDIPWVMKGRSVRPAELEEMPPAAGILEYRRPGKDWLMEGYVHFPTDILVVDKKTLALSEQMVFRFTTERGPVYFRIDIPEKLTEIDSSLTTQMSDSERRLLRLERQALIDDLKKKIIHYCNIRFRT
ncbi:hypothetical protein KBD71_05560 [Candidatus Woesebacteria bacterium]|nr:hypothetical protein [Candidatus Woesebacteria bacterium]